MGNSRVNPLAIQAVLSVQYSGGVLPPEPVGLLVYRKELDQPRKEPEPPSLCY